MKEFGLKVARQYQALIEYFVPDRLPPESEKAKQARMFLISHTVGPILGNSVPLALFYFDPSPNYAVLILALSITGFWVFPFLLKANFNYDRLVSTSVINLNFAILWSCYHYGGVASPTLPWMLIIPILSLFYIGGEKRLQPRLLAISAISFIVFLASYIYFSPALPDMPRQALEGLGIVSTIAALCYVATMAIYYSRIFNAGVELESEVMRRIKVADELREAIAEADRASLAKAEFLASMSHELRTPLNAVIGYSDLLLEDARDAGKNEMARDVNNISEAAHYLLRMLNLILDLSKIEAGHMTLNREQVSLEDLARETFSKCKEAIAKTGNTAVSKLHKPEEMVTLDKSRVLQILEMLVKNAAEHTKDGHVTIETDMINTDNGEQLQIRVVDDGNGIDPGKLDTIFNTLTSESDASDGRYGGTGLSLTVAHRLCTVMKGQLLVDSSVGVGTSFTITLPVDAEDQSTNATSQENLAEAA